MKSRQAVAFMSYVQSDDKIVKGDITEFRIHLSEAVDLITGEEFPIFQDRNDIQWGQNWSESITDSLDKVRFLIPIITPRFFKSKPCRDEMDHFIKREKELNRNDIILPVYYVSCPQLEEKTPSDPLGIEIKKHQWTDWRELRFEPMDSKEVKKALAKLAEQIRDALAREQEPCKKLPYEPEVQAGGAVTDSTMVLRPRSSDPSKTCFTSAKLRIIDEATPAGQAALAAGPRWDAQSFPGFWYDLDDGLSSETLEITVTNLNNAQRTIPDRDMQPGGGLVYESTRQLKQFEVVKAGAGTVENGLDANGNKVAMGATFYGKLGWMAEEYVAVNGKATKLGQLLIEQKSSASEKKTLTVGGTWQIGDYTLTANAIDAKATPRQVWLTLSWKGQKIDDKVLGQNDVYTYIEKSIAGESDVPLFVTYVDSVFAGATSDMVQLRFTWAVSRDITEVKESDIYGVFKVVGATDTNLHLENDASIDLSRASTVTLAGNFMFKVADDKNNRLRFYPMVQRTIDEIPTTHIKKSNGRVTRSFSAMKVVESATITVALTPAPANLFANPGYQVIETIPDGFSVIANTAGITTNIGNVWTFTQIGSAPFTYTLIAPTKAGSYLFGGIFKDQNAYAGTVIGASSVTVISGNRSRKSLFDF